MFPRAFWLSAILLIGLGAAVDVPFVFDETVSGVASYNSDKLEQAYAASSDLAGVPMVTQANDDEVIAFPVTGGGSTPEGEMENNVGELKKAYDARVEPGNRRVNREAIILAGKYPGDRTIDQISSIYSYLKNGWGYVADTRGIDNFRYANETLELGNLGDCDDFAILMSALIESIGGTTRIILARNSSIGGHAYTEVYLGNLNKPNNQVEGIIEWLKQEFNTGEIYTHINTTTKDVWLNLDWGPDEKGNTHPGGPFFQGDKHIVLSIRDRYEKTALKRSEFSKDRDAWLEKGNTLNNQDKYDDAIKAYDGAIRLDPNYVAAWDGKGNTLNNQGKYDDAIKAYDEAIRLDPKSAYAWCGKGYALSELGKYDEALKAYDEAIRLDPDYASAWINKGTALYGLGKYDEAVKAYDEAIRLDPNRALAKASKSMVLNEIIAENETVTNMTMNVTENITELYSQEGLVTLTLFVSELKMTGDGNYGLYDKPLYATVEGQDGSGNSFHQTTDSIGSVTIEGYPGIWSITASAPRYETKSVDWDLTEINNEQTIYLNLNEKEILKEKIDEMVSGDTISLKEFRNVYPDNSLDEVEGGVIIDGQVFLIDVDNGIAIKE